MNNYEKNKLAENCFLFQKYYNDLFNYVRYKKDDYLEITQSLEKATNVYKLKISQLNSMFFILDLLFSSNNFYSEQDRELFGWCLDMMRKKITDRLYQQLLDITKKEDDSLT